MSWPSDSEITLRWLATTSDWRLQESTDLSQPGLWRDVNLPAVHGPEGYQIRLPLTFGPRFYRLVSGP